jgi:hypothetical protein
MSDTTRELAKQVADWVARGFVDEAARLIEESATSASVVVLLDAQKAEILRLRGEVARLDGLLSGRPESRASTLLRGETP